MFCLSNLIKESNRKTVISSFFILLQLPENQFTICFIRQHKATWWNVQLISYIEPRFSLEKRKRKGKLFFAKGAAVSRSIKFLQGKNRTRVRDVR